MLSDYDLLKKKTKIIFQKPDRIGLINGRRMCHYIFESFISIKKMKIKHAIWVIEYNSWSNYWKILNRVYMIPYGIIINV